jgi:hypothetical protein
VQETLNGTTTTKVVEETVDIPSLEQSRIRVALDLSAAEGLLWFATYRVASTATMFRK